MKWMFTLSLNTLLFAVQPQGYLDAFDEKRQNACAKARAQLRRIENVATHTDCGCEKIDWDGWRCIITYTKKDAAHR